MRDVSDQIGPGQMPCCPLCDNEIIDYQPVALVSAHGSKGLAHAMCVDALDDDDEEE